MVKSFNGKLLDTMRNYVNLIYITLRYRFQHSVQNVLLADNSRKCSKTPVVTGCRLMANFRQCDLAGFGRSITSWFMNTAAQI